MPLGKYQADNDAIHAIRMSSARLAVAGAQPAGNVDSDINVKISKSNRSYGIRPRGVTLTRPINPTEDDKIRRTFLPVLTPTAFEAAGFQKGATITIGGTQWRVTARLNEDY